MKPQFYYFLILFYLLSHSNFGQGNFHFLASFAQFLEEKSDKKLYPETYHFDYAFEVEQVSNSEIKTFYILSSKNNNYFGMSSNLNGNETLLFDISLDQLILFCHLDSNQYAISGPLSFFNNNINSSMEYNFKKINDETYIDEVNQLKITLTQKEEYNNYGLKKGFWMIIQESSTLEFPLSEKGIILNLEFQNQKTAYTIKNRYDINIHFSIQKSKLLDFSILSDSTLNKH